MDGSISDIYYDKESNTVKNHKHEVIAYFDEGVCYTLDDKLSQTYCQDIYKVIKSTLDESKIPPQGLVNALKKAVAKANREKLSNKALALKDAAIALDLNPADLSPIQNKLLKIFKKNNIKYSRIKNPHVSTAYLLGYNKFADLAELIDTISNYTYEFKVIGLEVLPGATTNNDYLVLQLQAPNNFYKALNHIEEESDTLKFPGGFKTHISLYSIPKNSLTEQAIKDLHDLITDNDFTLNHQIIIKPQSISVFNNSRLLELRQKLRQAILEDE